MADLIRVGLEQKIPLAQPLTLIGRDISCHCIVEHVADISREHAGVRKYDDATYKVLDFGSRNGTFLNNEQIYEERPLQHLDRIRVGKYVEFVFSNPPKNSLSPRTRSIARLHRPAPTDESVTPNAETMVVHRMRQAFDRQQEENGE